MVAADPTIRVVAAVIRRGDRYLVAQRPAGSRHAGQWEFPGGKVEAGESDAEALGRELREELDVHTLSVGAPVAVQQDPGTPFTIVYLPVAIAGEPVCLDHAQLRWITPAELKRLALAPADARFASTLG